MTARELIEKLKTVPEEYLDKDVFMQLEAVTYTSNDGTSYDETIRRNVACIGIENHNPHKHKTTKNNKMYLTLYDEVSFPNEKQL